MTSKWVEIDNKNSLKQENNSLKQLALTAHAWAYIWRGLLSEFYGTLDRPRASVVNSVQSSFHPLYLCFFGPVLLLRFEVTPDRNVPGCPKVRIFTVSYFSMWRPSPITEFLECSHHLERATGESAKLPRGLGVE